MRRNLRTTYWWYVCIRLIRLLVSCELKARVENSESICIYHLPSINSAIARAIHRHTFCVKLKWRYSVSCSPSHLRLSNWVSSVCVNVVFVATVCITRYRTNRCSFETLWHETIHVLFSVCWDFFFSEVIYTLCLVFRCVFLLFGLLKCCRMVQEYWIRAARGECHQICVWLLSDNYLHFHSMQRWSTRRTLQCHPNRTNFSRRAFLFMSDRFSRDRTFYFCAPPTRLFCGFHSIPPFLLYLALILSSTQFHVLMANGNWNVNISNGSLND